MYAASYLYSTALQSEILYFYITPCLFGCYYLQITIYSQNCENYYFHYQLICLLFSKSLA